jgi:hypothetical protein
MPRVPMPTIAAGPLLTGNPGLKLALTFAVLLTLHLVTAAAAAAQTHVRGAGAASERPFATVLRLNGESDGLPSFRLTLDAAGVRLNATRDAVVGLEAGGSLHITHALLAGYPDADALRPAGSGTTLVRSLSVSADAGGRLLYSYAVNGVQREFGEEGSAWLAGLLRRYAPRPRG